MAQPDETFDSYDSVGTREDLSDIIYNISPTETPFMMMCGRGRATNRYSEWQIDTLAAVDPNNHHIEGDDAAPDPVAATERPGNYQQICSKTIVISGTQDVTNKAGRKKELSYQLAKKGKEMKRDIEHIATGNHAGVAGDSSTARETGSLEAWYETNTDFDATSGADGGFTAPSTIAARTDSSATRPLTEALVKGEISAAWTQGGEPSVIMCGPVNKQNISSFTGNSTRFDKGEDKRLVAAIDIYVSDFGTHKIVPNRFSRDRTVHILSPKLWSLIYLRSFRQHALAKTGDSEKRQLLCEWAVCSKNEAGSAIIADLTV